jgi:hypothetical protein
MKRLLMLLFVGVLLLFTVTPTPTVTRPPTDTQGTGFAMTWISATEMLKLKPFPPLVAWPLKMPHRFDVVVLPYLEYHEHLN